MALEDKTQLTRRKLQRIRHDVEQVNTLGVVRLPGEVTLFISKTLEDMPRKKKKE